MNAFKNNSLTNVSNIGNYFNPIVKSEYELNSIHVLRGEIYWADLGQGIDSEQGGIRPVLVIQNDIGNAKSTTTVVIPLTSKNKKSLPIHVLVKDTLLYESISLCEQIRAISKSRLIVRGKVRRISRVDPDILRQIESALFLELGMTS